MQRSSALFSLMLLACALVGVSSLASVSAFGPLATTTLSLTTTTSTTTTATAAATTSTTSTALATSSVTTTLTTSTKYVTTNSSGSVALAPLFNTQFIIYGLLIVGIPLMLLILARTLLAFVAGSIAMNILAIMLNLVAWYAAIANIFMCVVVLILFREQGEAQSG